MFLVLQCCLSGKVLMCFTFANNLSKRNQYNFRERNVIKFRELENLSPISYCQSVAPHNPAWMCTAKSSLLLYEDRSKSPREVHLLDVIGSKLKPAAGKSVFLTQNETIFDMCFVDDGARQLLIVAAGGKGLFAYNTYTDKLEWEVGGLLAGNKEDIQTTGVTADERRHLFVTDFGNYCIQMFSVVDGQYLGCLMKDVETLGKPGRLRWCENTTSLLTAHLFESKGYLNVIKVRYLSAEKFKTVKKY